MSYPVMIDLETLGQRPGCAITSIGAVKFDPRGGWIGDAFHIHIDVDSSVRHGLHCDIKTVMWWLGQGDDARRVMTQGQRDAAPLFTALDAFAAFFADSPAIWCNGASFDFPILTAAYHALQETPPWQYWQEYDLRTLKGLNKTLRIERSGTHHNALDDAIHQARLVQHILQSNSDLDS